MEVVDRPYDAAAAEVGMSTDALLAHLRGDGRAQDPAPGRRDPLPPPRRLLGQRDGRLAGARGARSLEVGARMAAVRGISHCYQRPTYADWPYSVFTMAHGRSKEECDAILDSIADEHDLHGDDRAALYSSTEFKKIRLHYFTDDYAAGSGARRAAEPRVAARHPNVRGPLRPRASA